MKRIFAFLFLVSASMAAHAQVSLEVSISGIRNQKGKMMYQLLDENENVVDQQIGVIMTDSCSFFTGNLKAGKYGVRYYHDENESMIMETGFRGMPKEGYGFSNNAKGSFGPPSFDKWLFSLRADTCLRLKISY